MSMPPPAQAGAPADSISEETELFASLSSALVEQAYKTADGYKELYLKLFSGAGLNLTQDEIAPLAARLGELRPARWRSIAALI